MKHRILLVFLAMALVVSLVAFAACAKEEEAPPVEEEAPPVEEEAPPVEEEEEEVWQWPEQLRLVATSPAAATYGALVGWSTPMAEDTGMKIRIACEDSMMLQHLWMKQGLFFCSGATNAYQMYAIDQYAIRDGGPFLTGVLYPITKMFVGFGVRGDSDIKTPHDIKPGTRFIYITMMPQGKYLMNGLLAWAGLSEEDVEWIPAGSIAANGRLLMDGRGDIAMGQPESPFWLEIEASPHGLSFIELDPRKDPEGSKPLLEIMSEWSYGIASGHVCQSAQGIWMLARVVPHVCRWDQDPDLVYHVVKWLAENYDKYKDSHPQNVQMTIDNLMHVAETFWIPIHPGTKRYLEEIGRWTPAHEARNQQNIALMNRWTEAYQTAINMADEKGIEVDPENEEWIELWENYKEQLNLPKFIMFPGLD